MDKRTFLKSIFLGTAGVVATGFGSKLFARNRKKWDGIFRLPDLPYSYDALEPFIDGETMKLHHTKHHAAYTDKFNLAVAEAGLTGKSAMAILKDVSGHGESIRNNGGGYINHRLFWRVLTPVTGRKPSLELSTAIDRDFGSYENFRESFNTASKSVFGSGWAWLIVDENKNLKVTTTLNQDNPMMDIARDKGMPILCLDLWEHAYYMKNQNRRVDYIDAFWNVVDWDYVSKRYENTIKPGRARS